MSSWMLTPYNTQPSTVSSMCTRVPEAKFFQEGGATISLRLIILELEGLGMAFVLFSPPNAHKLPLLNEDPKAKRYQKSESTAGSVLSHSTTEHKELSHALLALLRHSQHVAPSSPAQLGGSNRTNILPCEQSNTAITKPRALTSTPSVVPKAGAAKKWQLSFWAHAYRSTLLPGEPVSGALNPPRSPEHLGYVPSWN